MPLSYKKRLFSKKSGLSPLKGALWGPLKGDGRARSGFSILSALVKLSGPSHPFRLPALSLLSFLSILFLSACSAESSRLSSLARLGFSLGDFGGSGGAALEEKLSQIPPQRGKGAIPVLSGTALFTTDKKSGEERVVTSEEGNEYLFWEKDPLTDQVWTVKARVKREVPKNFDFAKVTGTLKVDWELRDPESKALLDQGSDLYYLTRSLGGYLEELKRPEAKASNKPSGTNKIPKYLETPEETPDDPTYQAIRAKLLDELSRMAADKLSLTLRPESLRLARAFDHLSLNAERLAFKGLWEEAAQIWKALLEENPSYHPALYNLGLYHERMGELPEAWSLIRSAFLSSQEILYRDALARLSVLLKQSGSRPRSRAGFL
jgi:hypothetical protein